MSPSKSPVECRRGRTTPTTDASPDRHVGIAWRTTTSAAVLPWSRLASLHAAGDLPAPEELLLVRLMPGSAEDWTLTLRVLPADGPPVSHDFPFVADPARLDADGRFEALFAFASGPGPEVDCGLPYLSVVDVSEGAAHAPRVEVTAFGAAPVPIDLEGASAGPASDTLACVQIPGPTFDFDSSFIRPSVVDALKEVDEALKANPDGRLLVLGHTDRVGTETYNKDLSDRRARSTFAFITNDAATWEELYEQEKWGPRATQTILADLGHDPGAIDGKLGPKTEAAMRSFLGVPASAKVAHDAAFRTKLFLAYMTGKHDVQVSADRFVGPRFVGCGELNPVAPPNAAELANASPGNEVNRRVVLYVLKNPPPAIPCKLHDLGPCHAQTETPGPLGAFRCAFYDGLAAGCPCETSDLPPPPATKDVPPPGTKKTAPKILVFVGEPEGAAPGTFDPHHLKVEQHTKVNVRWKVADADEVELFVVTAGKRASFFKGPKLESTFEHTPFAPGATYELEARRAGALATAKIDVEVKAATTVTIKSFAVEPDSTQVGELSFTWNVAGPFGRVQLLPYGKELSADMTPDGDGGFVGPPLGDGTYVLQAFDKKDALADTRSVVFKLPKKTIDPPPKPPKKTDTPPPPVVKAALGAYLEGDPKVPKPKLEGVDDGKQVVLEGRVLGPWKKIYISPFPGLVASAGGDGWTGTTTVTPTLKAQAPAPDGRYTLTVDEAASASCEVKTKGVGKTELTLKKEWDPELKKLHYRYVEMKVKLVAGIKCKISAGEGETVSSAESKLDKGQVRFDTVKEVRMDQPGAPEWIALSVEAVKGSAGVTIDFQKKLADVSAKLQVTFKTIKFAGKFLSGTFTPVGEVEFIGIRVKKGDDGKWALVAPGEVVVKAAAEFPVGKVAKEVWGLPWDLFDLKLTTGLKFEATPNYLELATTYLGYEGLVVAGMLVLGFVAVGTIIGVILIGIQVDEFRAAHQQRPYADKYFAEIKAGIPAGMKDASWENKGTPVDPGAGDSSAKSREKRGYAFGMYYRGLALEAYRQQPDVLKAMAGMRAAGEESGMSAPDLDAALEKDLVESFHHEWNDKFAHTLANIEYVVRLAIFKEVYKQFVKDSPGNAIAHDICFRSLFMDGRTGVDYDFDDIDDEIFVQAMADQWADTPRQPMLEAAWTLAGYNPPPKLPPDAFERLAKRKKNKDDTGVVDVATGKPVPRDQATRRDEVLMQLRNRGVIPTKIARTRLEAVAGTGWVHVEQTELVLSTDVKVPCGSGDAAPYRRVVLQIFSVDHGTEYVLADVVTARVERAKFQPKPVSV